MSAASVAGPPAGIGPNALLQLVPVLERVGGPALREELFAAAGVFHLPRADGLIAEGPVARVHQQMRRQLPDLAPSLAWEAGRRTADYIIANRIPRPVVLLLRALPPALAGPLLTRAIEKHAWTFAGSGRFEVESMRPLTFALHDNPVVRGEHAEHPICHWHAAVFERLFGSLVTRRARVTETACCAMGAPACRFEIHRTPAA
jgi:divinyl protochlorophyllide a 8-vinyl-reductase